MELPILGSKSEIKTFTEVQGHYSMSKQDLEQRIYRKNGFDDVDKMVSSYIDESNWPYKSLMFDPIPYTILQEKSGRLVGNKPKGRMVPREGGDTLGAYINNELLSFQWDDNTRLGQSMLSKWVAMDQGTRKYGAKFGLAKWRYETRMIEGKRKVFYDGPDFTICNSRDTLANIGYNYVNKWFQHREYVTLNELQHVNDAARSEPTYKNLDMLRDAMTNEAKSKGDKRETQYQLKNKTMKGLSDYLGMDEVFKTIEVVTEYRPDRWITFAPRYGVILRDINNPYKHGEIPVVPLCYYPNEDDLYGNSEYEAISKLTKGINCLMSQYIDNVTVDLYPPLMVNPVNVRMNTLEFTPEAKWLMNNPGKDVVRMETSTAATNNFQSAYAIMKGAAMSGFGENSQGVSQVNPNQDSQRVTAAEIKDTAFSRSIRDNMNQIVLAEALKKQVNFWHSMNQQLLFTATKDQQKVIRIVGRDAVEFFKRQGLADIHPTQDDIMQMQQAQAMGVQPEEPMPGPSFPVEVNGQEVPKFELDQMGEGGNLYIEPGDLMGNYDYLPDVETMHTPTDEEVEKKLELMVTTITNPAVLQMLQMEGKKPKISELLVKMFEATNVIKDAEAYFEDLPPAPPVMQGGMNGQGQTDPSGAGSPTAGIPGQGSGQPARMGQGNQALPGNPNPQLMGRPQGV
jgi:hypothetical protein